MEITALNAVEKRIVQLELKVSSKIPQKDVNVNKVKAIVDSLHEVDTVLISTLSGRERITSLLKRVDDLEKILDPSYLETHCNLDLKVESILESESELKYFSDSLARLEELEPVMNSKTEQLKTNPERMNRIMSNLLTIKEECNQQSGEIKRLVAEYKASMMYLTQLFVDLEASITKLEMESMIE